MLAYQLFFIVFASLAFSIFGQNILLHTTRDPETSSGDVFPKPTIKSFL